VAIAPCDVRGGLQGDPVVATAQVIEDPALIDRVRRLVVDRYGVVGWFFVWLDKVRKRESVVLAIEVPETVG
jgi:hypothetical protein